MFASTLSPHHAGRPSTKTCLTLESPLSHRQESDTKSGIS